MELTSKTIRIQIDLINKMYLMNMEVSDYQIAQLNREKTNEKTAESPAQVARAEEGIEPRG